MKITSLIIAFVFVIVSGCSNGLDIKKEAIPKDTSTAVKAQIESLYSDNAKERAAALDTLGEMGKSATPAVPFIIDMLDDNETLDRPGLLFVRSHASGDSWIMIPVACVLSVTYPWRYYRERRTVANHAIRALGTIGDPRALKPVAERLDSYNKHMRQDAIDALEKIGADESITGELLELLDDDVLHVRYAAYEMLGDIKATRAVEPLIKRLKTDDMAKAAIALGKIKDLRAVEPLIKTLGSDPGQTSYVYKISVNIALGELGDERAVEALIRELNYVQYPGHPSSSTTPRVLAAEALGKIGGDKAIKALNEVISDIDVQVGSAAIKALEKLQGIDDKKIKALLRKLKSGRIENDRLRAATLLSKTSDPRVADALYERIKDAEVNNDNLRYVIALAEMKDPRAIKPLITLVDQMHPGITPKVIRVLSEFGDRQTEAPLIDLYNRILKETPSARGSIDDIIVALGKVGGERSADILIARLKSVDINRPIYMIEPLIVEALGSIGDPRALGELIRMLGHTDEIIRAKSVEALKKITGESFDSDYEKWRAWWRENKGNQMKETE